MATTCQLSVHSSVGKLFSSLSNELQVALVEHGLSTASLFRGGFDGSEEDAVALCQELGGRPVDVPILIAMWTQCEATARLEIRRLANCTMTGAKVHVAVMSRKRGRAEPGLATDVTSTAK